MAGLVKWLAKIKEVVENANSELECRNRDSLVHTVEHAREVQIRRKPERRKAEASDTQPRERLGVCATGQAVGHHRALGIFGKQRGAHRGDELPVEARFDGNVVMHRLAPERGTDQRVDLLEELLLESGQESAVHLSR